MVLFERPRRGLLFLRATLEKYVMIFFEFAFSRVPLQALALPLMVMGQYPSTGTFVHFKRPTESHHYFGHTDDAAMRVLARSLNELHIPFRQIDARQLSQDKRRRLRALRDSGQLG